MLTTARDLGQGLRCLLALHHEDLAYNPGMTPKQNQKWPLSTGTLKKKKELDVYTAGVLRSSSESIPGSTISPE